MTRADVIEDDMARWAKLPTHVAEDLTDGGKQA